MHKQIPTGITDYKEIIENNYTYIDKTLLIKEWLDIGAKVTLVTRPRRFGKSISLSMLRYFFEKEEKSTKHLFEGTKIWKEEGFREIQGTYSVIFLSFKDVKCDTWEEAYQKIASLLSNEIRRTIMPISSQLDIYAKEQFDVLLARKVSTTDLTSSLKWTTQMLYEQTKKNAIILIDEYDTPITYAYSKGYYQAMVDFMRNLLSEGLKDNTYLEKGFMTGVVRTAKDGILSGLNNPLICTMLDPAFTDKFGFTEEEVEALLVEKGYGDKKEEVKSWYNGYTLAVEYAHRPDTAHLSTHIYNPWSILQYLQNKASPRTYWANTGSTELLEELMKRAGVEVQEELTLLLQGSFLPKKTIDTNVILLDLDKRAVEPWSFLFFAGYVTTIDHVFEGRKHFYTLSIPNEEILELYQTMVQNALAQQWVSHDLQTFHTALIMGNKETFQTILQDFVLTFCSYHDLPTKKLERSLHLFVLGLLAALSERYMIKSNIESGYGRYDILMHPKNTVDTAILIEFKQGKQKDLEKLSLEALEQIKTSHYERQLHDLGYKGKVHCYGIAATGKKLLVKLEDLVL